ncbi:hypothetical protein Taro_025310 [Colocasia esculenta]|uniref:SWIM-type domain-containing protein n=1 Tax=Colocasia esculenta TaxID=4460 RepID=A0A843VDV3_COLES|nr:hypothetical protein [Colocasia esculenta]
MRELCVQGELWARKENPNYWANAFFQGELCGEMYSNPAESFNSWIAFGHKSWLWLMKEETSVYCGKQLCPKVDAYLKNLMDSACGIVVNCSNGQLFEVLTKPTHVVDLQVGECTCREWQIRRLPCKNVCVVAHKIGCNVEKYCSLYFSTRFYQNCYVETIKPISNQDKPLVDFENEMNCDFFMWCDKVQSFVDSTTTCEKDEKIKKLENRIAWLEDELRGSKSLINKAKVVVQSLPKTFAFLSILDKDGGDGSDGDSHSQKDMNVHLD